MPDLTFEVLGVEPARHAAVPTLCFKLAIGQQVTDGMPALPVEHIAMQCQLRIDTRRRIYKPREKERLSELFGAPERWSKTLNTMLWTHASTMVPAFDAEPVQVDLLVPCSFDFNLATTKYFSALEHDKLSLLLLFSGTVFYRNAQGALAMELVSWSKEVRHRLPYQTWQQLMDLHYPDQAWLSINRAVFDALCAYKRRQGCTSFDEALSSLLPVEEVLVS